MAQARIGFVGAGSHANSSLYPSLVAAPSAHLAAVCDLVAEKAETAAKRWGGDRWYTDLEEMLDKEQLDGVCVCGPPKMHFELGQQIVRRGLPVFVEKPSAMTAAEAQQLAGAAKQAGVWGMVAFMKRHAPAYVLAKQVTESAEFGGVQQFHVRFTQGEYPDIWGLEAPRAFLVGQVVHIFDLTRFFGGDVAEVFALRNDLTHLRFGYAITVRFASGAVGTMTLNGFDHATPWRDITEHVDVSGAGESVTVHDMQTVEHFSAQDWRPAGTDSLGAAYQTWVPNFQASINGYRLIGYMGELEHFAQCALSKTPASASLEDGAKALAIGEAVWESVERGKVVAVR